MSLEEREIIMAENPPVIDGIHYGSCYFDWGWKGCGFGQLDFRIDRESGEIRVANECMGRERVRSILIALANHIADNAILDDEDLQNLAG
jgi:hypothetical protein